MRRLVALIVGVLAVLVLTAGPAAAVSTPARATGYPGSANGASSMHLAWAERIGATREVGAVLEVLEPPTTSDLYFWAVQADFVDGDAVLGTAHLGLQWDPSRPGRTAANFGGYVGGREVGGTVAFDWVRGHRYRLRIAADGAGWWKGEITDAATGRTTLVNRLRVGGTSLARPYVWSEVFARCDAPSTAVRWSDVSPVPTGLIVTYQSYRTGWCTNTTAERTSRGVIQRTNAVRIVRDFELLRTGRTA